MEDVEKEAEQEVAPADKMAADKAKEDKEEEEGDEGVYEKETLCCVLWAGRSIKEETATKKTSTTRKNSNKKAPSTEIKQGKP